MAYTEGSVNTNTEYDSYFWVRWSRQDYSTSGGYSIINWSCGVYCGHSFYSNAIKMSAVTIDGTQVYGGGNYSNYGVGEHTIASDSLIVYHNPNGTKTLTVGSFTGWLYSGHNYSSGGDSWELPTIPRYATYSLSASGTTSTSTYINWYTSDNVDKVEYRLNGGGWIVAEDYINKSSGGFTISGLTPNTYYVIELDVKRTDSQQWSSWGGIYSQAYVTTYQTTIAYISLSSKTINSITVTSSCNVDVSSTQYRIKQSGGSYGSYQSSATFSGLSSNTSYVVEVKKVGAASGESGTATLSVTTYDIARLTTYPNFNLGNNVTVNYSNPSGAPIAVGIYDTNGANAYASYRTATGTSYTFEFTDEELDKLYKAMSSNSLQVSIYLNTNNNAYRDYKLITVTLTGNQKTGHIKIGSVKRGKFFIGANGTKRAVVWVGDSNGVARRCI